MQVILVMVMSVNGKITAGENTRAHDWSSKEDRVYFAALKAKSRLIIMGRKTYEAAKPAMILSPKTFRIVLTRKLKSFNKLAVPGQLEFTDDSPETLLKNLEKRGYKEALLVGGAEINAAFIRTNLIDELWLTVEPVILGCGKGLFRETEFNIGLQLKSSKRLNPKGTLLLKYAVKR